LTRAAGSSTHRLPRATRGRSWRRNMGSQTLRSALRCGLAEASTGPTCPRSRAASTRAAAPAGGLGRPAMATVRRCGPQWTPYGRTSPPAPRPRRPAKAPGRGARPGTRVEQVRDLTGERGHRDHRRSPGRRLGRRQIGTLGRVPPVARFLACCSSHWASPPHRDHPDLGSEGRLSFDGSFRLDGGSVLPVWDGGGWLVRVVTR